MPSCRMGAIGRPAGFGGPPSSSTSPCTPRSSDRPDMAPSRRRNPSSNSRPKACTSAPLNAAKATKVGSSGYSIRLPSRWKTPSASTAVLPGPGHQTVAGRTPTGGIYPPEGGRSPLEEGTHHHARGIAGTRPHVGPRRLGGVHHCTEEDPDARIPGLTGVNLLSADRRSHR